MQHFNDLVFIPTGGSSRAHGRGGKNIVCTNYELKRKNCQPAAANCSRHDQCRCLHTSSCHPHYKSSSSPQWDPQCWRRNFQFFIAYSKPAWKNNGFGTCPFHTLHLIEIVVLHTLHLMEKSAWTRHLRTHGLDDFEITQPTITISMASPHPSVTSLHNSPQTPQTPADYPHILPDSSMDFALDFAHLETGQYKNSFNAWKPI